MKTHFPLAIVPNLPYSVLVNTVSQGLVSMRDNVYTVLELKL